MFGNMRSIMLGALLMLGVFGAVSSRAQHVSTFDSDEEGWWSSSDSPITCVGTGGNPGGYIQIDNRDGYMDAHAPDKFLGDLSAYLGGTLSFDAINISGIAPDFERFGRVDIHSASVDSNSFAVLGGSGMPPNDGLWHTYSIPLSLDLWSGRLNEVLGSVDDIRIDLRPVDHFGAGDAVMGFDNFRITGPDLSPGP